MLGKELDQLATKQQAKEIQYGNLTNERTRLLNHGSDQTNAVDKELNAVAGDLRKGADVLASNLRQNPGTILSSSLFLYL